MEKERKQYDSAFKENAVKLSYERMNIRRSIDDLLLLVGYSEYCIMILERMKQLCISFLCSLLISNEKREAM